MEYDDGDEEDMVLYAAEVVWADSACITCGVDDEDGLLCDGCEVGVGGYFARHVSQRALNPRLWNYTTPYDVVSTICRPYCEAVYHPACLGLADADLPEAWKIWSLASSSQTHLPALGT